MRSTASFTTGHETLGQTDRCPLSLQQERQRWRESAYTKESKRWRDFAQTRSRKWAGKILFRPNQESCCYSMPFNDSPDLKGAIRGRRLRRACHSGRMPCSAAGRIDALAVQFLGYGADAYNA